MMLRNYLNSKIKSVEYLIIINHNEVIKDKFCNFKTISRSVLSPYDQFFWKLMGPICYTKQVVVPLGQCVVTRAQQLLRSENVFIHPDPAALVTYLHKHIYPQLRFEFNHLSLNLNNFFPFLEVFQFHKIARFSYAQQDAIKSNFIYTVQANIYFA